MITNEYKGGWVAEEGGGGALAFIELRNFKYECGEANEVLKWRCKC